MVKVGDTERTRVRRSPRREVSDPAVLYDVLDRGLVCHVGFVDEHQPMVIPMAYGRDGDRLLLHGSTRSRLMRTLSAGAPVCVTVTLLDGLVLARSAFNHSMNYRSAVILGRARPICGEQRKLEALKVTTEHLVPGRWQHVRQPSDKELAVTAVLEVLLTESSVKVRTGPPDDHTGDYDMDVWAGTIPMATVFGEPVADPAMTDDQPTPNHVSDYRRPTRPRPNDVRRDP